MQCLMTNTSDRRIRRQVNGDMFLAIIILIRRDISYRPILELAASPLDSPPVALVPIREQ